MGGKESHKAKLPVRELVFNQVMTESHTTSDFDELTQQKAEALETAAAARSSEIRPAESTVSKCSD